MEAKTKMQVRLFKPSVGEEELANLSSVIGICVNRQGAST